MPHPLDHWLFLRMDPEQLKAERLGTLAKMRALLHLIPSGSGCITDTLIATSIKHLIDEVIELCSGEEPLEYGDVAVRLSALNELWPGWLGLLYDSRLTSKERGDV